MTKSPENSAGADAQPTKRRADLIEQVDAGQKADLADLRKFELALLDASSSFNRWVVSCAQATGTLTVGLSTTDVTVLRLLACSNRSKRTSEISFALNIEDMHIVTYALKKLDRGGYVESTKQGKELYFSATKSGVDFLDEYDKVRVSLLLGEVKAVTDGRVDLPQMAQFMRIMSSIYEQAARAAMTL